MENSPSSTPGTTGGSGSSATLIDQAKDQAKEAVQQTQQKAGQVVDQARQQVKSQLSVQKDRAVDGLESVAEALRNTSQQLHEGQQAGVGQYADSAAELVERASGYLREREVEDLVFEVENFARRNPVMFLTGAFLIGFSAARFLKSSGGGGAGGSDGYSSGGWSGSGAGEGGSRYGDGYGAGSTSYGGSGYGGGSDYGTSSVGEELPSAYDVAMERGGPPSTDSEGGLSSSSGFGGVSALPAETDSGTATAYDDASGAEGDGTDASYTGATTGSGDQR